MKRIVSSFGVIVQQDENLGRFTAARLGGSADYLYVAKGKNFDELLDIARSAWEQEMSVQIIGGGANILISDKGVRGLTIVNRIAAMTPGNWHDGRNLAVTSGVNLNKLTHFCMVNGLSGMEWAVGVPGTIGGAIVNNAGAHGSSMADSIADVVVFEADKGIQLYSNADLQYAYRYSTLKARQDRRFVVLLATLILQADEPTAIQARMDEYNAYRKRTQPPGASLGSIFKNPPDDYAGRLIESAGLKGFQIGGAQVSPVHANFFINVGDTATATDYFQLIRHVQKLVFEQWGLQLELEIETIGEW